MSSLHIDVVNNGFVVKPITYQRHAEAKDEEVVVFETHKALFDYIETTCVINNTAVPFTDNQ